MTLDPEKIAVIRANPNVVSVDEHRIRYTEDFKRRVITAYRRGHGAIELFRAAGLGPELLGHKRIERCIARWKESQPGTDMSETDRTTVDDGPMVGRLPDFLLLAGTPDDGDMKVVAAVTLDTATERAFEEHRRQAGLSRARAFESAIRSWIAGQDERTESR